MSSSDDDSQQRFVLGFLFALIALVISVVVGTVVVKGVAEGKKAVISGFHDATGDATLNAELAKQRAFAVRDALKALGVAEDKIELKKPEETTATGSNAEARLVEVALGA